MKRFLSKPTAKWGILSLFFGSLLGYRMLSYAPVLLSDIDEAHYAMVGYYLWKYWPTHRSFYQPFLNNLGDSSSPIANAYLLLPTHFPLGYVIHGLPQILGPGGWAAGRYWSISISLIMALGLWALVWRIWGPLWATVSMAVMAATQGWVTGFVLITAQGPALALLMWGLFFLADDSPSPRHFFVGSTLITLAAHIRAEVWLAVGLLLVYIGIVSVLRVQDKRLLFAGFLGMVLPTALLHWYFWPMILHPWEEYLSALGVIHKVQTWHFKHAVTYSGASRLLGVSLWPHRTPISFWMFLLPLVAPFFKTRHHRAVSPPKIILWLILILHFTFAIIVIFFTLKGATPYHSYWRIFTPLALVLFPWAWQLFRKQNFASSFALFWLFTVWVGMLGYALSSEILFFPNAPGFRILSTWVGKYLPANVLQAHDLPPLRVYQSVYLIVLFLIGWLVLYTFSQVRFSPVTLSWGQSMLLIVALVHFTPLTYTMENLCKPSIHTFTLQRERVQAVREFLNQQLPSGARPTLVRQDVILAIDLRQEIQLAGSTVERLDNWQNKAHVVFDGSPPSRPFRKEYPALTVPTTSFCPSLGYTTTIWIRSAP